MIGSNGSDGVEMAGLIVAPAEGNSVQGNQLTFNFGDGVFLGSYTISNTIGGTADGDGNTISGNLSNGVQIAGILNQVQGNFIGTDSSGKTAEGNGGDGVLIIAQAFGNTIGETTAGARNIISGNLGDGVLILGIPPKQEFPGDNTVQCNYIGTDKSGTQAVPNLQDGVSIISGNPAAGTYITIANNLISGNRQDGISLDSSTGIQIEGNSIGTDQSGTSPLANGQDGVAVSNVNVSVSTGQNGNTIGGTTPGTRNVISGNGQGGILIQSSTETLVEGNYIGTDQKGSLSLPNNNQQYGIWVLNSGGPNTIGGTVPGSCNVISGNGYGVLLALSSSTLIEGNLIGTDVTGQSALGNDVGVLIFGASENTVGGSDASAENVISGNTSCGIYIRQNNNKTKV